jgi:hypothetical protein
MWNGFLLSRDLGSLRLFIEPKSFLAYELLCLQIFALKSAHACHPTPDGGSGSAAFSA